MSAKPWLIAIMGATASGKTALAIKLAQYFHTEILSVDARQMYLEMSLGTAKPTPEQLAAATHHFIDCLSIQENYDAGRFEQDALELLSLLYKNHKVVIAVGGSTLYYKALLEGIDPFPPVNPEVRETVRKMFSDEGINGLQEYLSKLDPDYFARVDKHNPSRLIRALEVSMSTGHPYSSFLNQRKKDRPFHIIKLGMDVSRQELYHRIEKRCDEMLSEGLLYEVKMLYPHRHRQALQTVGYQEFFDFLDGKLGYDQAVDLFKQHTRNYAKRQMTWLRKEEGITWFAPGDIEGILKYLGSEMSLSA